ncbi:MAG: hypothetical protein RR033_06665 [Clostridia bacterium]
MDEITLKAFAKINLTLDICGVSKGFHLLDMLVASIALCDDVRLVSSKDKSFCFMDEKLADDKNCAMRALKLMQSNFKIGNYEIHIKKGIPLSGGLGGSTADGVAVVKGLSEMLGIPRKKISTEFLLQIGSDAPCMYDEGIKRVRGIGEIVTKISEIAPYNIGIISGSGVSTVACYQMFDQMKLQGGTSTAELINNIGKPDFDLKKYLSNDLLLPALRLNSDIAPSLARLAELGADGVNMSGSGSAVYGLFKSNVSDKLIKTNFI